MRYSFLIGMVLIVLHPHKSCALEKGSMIPTSQAVTLKTIPIYNQDDVLKTVTDFVEIPVLFPTVIKAETGKIYFAYTDLQDNFKRSSPKGWYLINIGYTPGCFAHYCTLGSIMAELKGKITPDYTFKQEGDKMTQVEVSKVSVDLTNSVKGYYTPGFPAGSYVDPKIQWYHKDILYTIQWATAEQKELVQMANSAIIAELNKH